MLSAPLQGAGRPAHADGASSATTVAYRDGLASLCATPRVPLVVTRDLRSGAIGAFAAGSTGDGAGADRTPADHERVGFLPPIYPEWLGDRAFNEAYGVRFPYVAGAMAQGLSSARAAIAMGRAGMLGIFGAGGLPNEVIERAVAEMATALSSGEPWGVNVIHSPHRPLAEAEVAEILVERRVPCVEASAFIDLTPPLVRLSASGLRRDAKGRIVRARLLLAKVSRPETARLFLGPPPEPILAELLRTGQISEAERQLARRLPVASDLTVEADSGGHTDRQALTAAFPTIAGMAEALAREHGLSQRTRVGAAGGLGCPAAVAAAFGMGAAYVMTGSVNQATAECDLSEPAKRLLAAAGPADVITAPSADLFESGARVQVLRRGTLFGVRAQRLYDAYARHPSLEAIPEAERRRIEIEVLGATVEEVWSRTRAFFEERDPKQLQRAAEDPRHRMALVFRWYLGMSSKWAIQGDPDRQLDYQIWCGPALGAFNEWVRGSFLEPLANRGVVQIAVNLLEGAAVLTRAQQLRALGAAVPAAAFRFVPRPLD